MGAVVPRPVHELLHPACPVRPAWAVFDAGWYLHRYADARAVCKGDAHAALLYYLRVGGRLGHSPSLLFDEAFYMARHPDVAALVREGAYASGFDHYAQSGHRALSPHWLFDDALYADLYEDMTLDVLDAHGCFGRYDHYLQTGQRERRMGQHLFDGAFYTEQAIAAGADPAAIEALGPYVHYLARLSAAEDELSPSVYFDPLWYLEAHPVAKAAVLRGKYLGALHHYLTNETPADFDPLPQFSEGFYRVRHPDIAAAIEMGMYRTGYQQFVQFGVFELRQPREDIDLAYYRDMHEEVRTDINTGAVRDAFAHLRTRGLAAGLAHSPPAARPAVSEPATRAQFVARARALVLAMAGQVLDFSYEGTPVLSIVMAVHDRFELTFQAIASIRQNHAGAIQLIIVDNGSADETRRLARYVAGAVIIRRAETIGFVRACNLALPEVAAPALLYLNNDVELWPGALAAALRRLESDPGIGAVGAKIVRTDGRLQEAGSIIWAEGTTTGYLRDASPLAAEANFVRDVDYASAVFLLCRTAAVRTLGGFDEAYAPAYFEDADLCVRLIQAGYRIVYDPAVVLTHLEFGSAATSEVSMALMRRARRIFRQKQAGFLAAQPAPGDDAVLIRARGRHAGPRVLFIEDTIPVRRLGSGFVRANDVVAALAAGAEVHVFPYNGVPVTAAEARAALPERVECLYDRDSTQLAAFLKERRGAYDLVWISRTHNFARVIPHLRAAGMGEVPIVLDTEAAVSCREAMRAGPGFDLAAAIQAEFAGAEICRAILAVSDAEVALLRAAGLPHVAKLGTAIAPQPTPAAFADRTGLLFVGAIHRDDSPNLDSLRWYAAEIWPALCALMPDPPVLTIVGYLAPEVALGDLATHPGLRWHGAAEALAPHYNAARLFIAPTRIAAGTPYKLYEAAAMGLPAIATAPLAAQLGWADGAALLTATDAPGFAAAICLLYPDEALWMKIRETALAKIAMENDPTDFRNSVADIVRRNL
jgi:GT2 family glycosyltransferase